MDITNGGTDWGFTASDIWNNGMTVVASLAAFILLGLVLHFVPGIFYAIRHAMMLTPESRKEHVRNGGFVRDVMHNRGWGGN